MTAKELIENIKKLGKEFERRSEILRNLTEKKNEKYASDRR